MKEVTGRMEKFLYLDDSGQLSDNGSHHYFLYGGIFIDGVKTRQELLNKINAFCKTRHYNKEIKGSSIKGKYRKKLLEIIGDVKGVHQVFVIEKNSLLTRVKFDAPYSVRLHKNYVIRRLIEDIYSKGYIANDDTLHVKIDNEVLNSAENIKMFEDYLNEYWSKNRSIYHKNNPYWQFVPVIGSNFTVEYKDSVKDRLTQAADLVANTKYRRFKGIEKCGSIYLKTDLCLKLPYTFYSPKSSSN